MSDLRGLEQTALCPRSRLRIWMRPGSWADIRSSCWMRPTCFVSPAGSRSTLPIVAGSRPARHPALERHPDFHGSRALQNDRYHRLGRQDHDHNAGRATWQRLGRDVRRTTRLIVGGNIGDPLINYVDEMQRR
ncbi:MAG: hypothetical protein M0C28_44410 [Candidatus Moduliflexus flocculans]|nr:hypothetical protein [Candidatus Moduliflexus flocculans]